MNSANTGSSAKGAFGCLFLLVCVGLGLSVTWYGFLGNNCPSYWLSDKCALNLIKETCGKKQEVTAIVNIEDSPASQDIRAARQVTYEFKKVPDVWAVTSGETFRTKTLLFYVKKVDQNNKPVLDKDNDPIYEWQASCADSP